MAGEETVVEEIQETTEGAGLFDAALVEQPKQEKPVEEKAEVKEPEEKKEEAKEPEKKEEETVSISKAELEKLQKQIAEKEKMIARQGTEVGELRKTKETLSNEIETLRTSIDFDKLAEDTPGTLRNAAALASKEQELKQIDADIELAQRKTLVTEFIPEYEATVEDIAALLKSDGLDDDAVRKFKANPYLLHADTAVNLAKRATLIKENAALKAENEKLKGKRDTVLENIEKAANAGPTITGKGAGTAETTAVDEFDPSLSTAERIALWQKRKQKEK